MNLHTRHCNIWCDDIPSAATGGSQVGYRPLGPCCNFGPGTGDGDLAEVDEDGGPSRGCWIHVLRVVSGSRLTLDGFRLETFCDKVSYQEPLDWEGFGQAACLFIQADG